MTADPHEHAATDRAPMTTQSTTEQMLNEDLDGLGHAIARACAVIDRLTAEKAALLAALKEMRDAMAATMRVISIHDDHDRITEEMVREFESIGIHDGFGVRSQQAIAKAEGRV